MKEYPFFTIRLGTQDQMVLTEVLYENEYRLPDRFDPDDVIVDIGANIGAFAIACLIRGAGKVVCYEPDPKNFVLLQDNLDPFWEKVNLHKKALWPGGNAYLLQREGHLTAMSHCVSSYGEPVEGLTLGEILRPLGHVRLLKLDCEGGEWPGLFSALERDLAGVQEIAGELHHEMKMPDWPAHWTEAALAKMLSGFGYNVQVVPSPKSMLTSHFFATRNQGPPSRCSISDQGESARSCPPGMVNSAASGKEAR